MTRALRLLPAIFAMLPLAGLAQDSRRTLTPKEREGLAWIASLFPSDPAGRPYVEVTCHNDSQRPGSRWKQALACRGFLLDERPDSFRVWCLDLLPRRIERSRRTVLESLEFKQHFEIARLELDAGVSSLIEAIAITARKRAEPPAGGSSYLFNDDEDISSDLEALQARHQALVLASVCAKLGRADLAVRLVEMSTCGPFPPVSDFTDLLRGHCIRVFGQTDFSREDVLAWHRRYLGLFPRDPEAILHVRVLERMIAEDADRRHKAPVDGAEDREIEDLVYDLRNASEPLPMESMSSRWPVTPHPWKKSGAPAQLIAIGHRAVPLLIDALADSRPTRCVEPTYGSFSRPEGMVEEVGGYARMILAEIAHISFYGTEANGWHVDAAVREWWEHVQKDGEAAALATVIAAHSSEKYANIVDPARRLAQIDPARAVPAIGAAIDAAQTVHVRGELVITLGEIPGDGPVPKLLRVVADAPDLHSRLEAAKALQRRGRREGLATMLREWNQDGLPDLNGPFYEFPGRPDAWHPQHPFLDSGYGIWAGGVAADLACFLASTADPEASAALLAKLAHGSAMHRFAAMCAAPRASADGPPDPLLADLRRATLRLLVGELANQAPSGTVLGNIPERYCDESARRIAGLTGWPFDWGAPLANRDRQIAAIREAWDAELRQSPPEASEPGAESRSESQPASRPGK